MAMADQNDHVQRRDLEAGRAHSTTALGVVCLALLVLTAVPGVEAAEKVPARLMVKDALTMPKKADVLRMAALLLKLWVKDIVRSTTGCRINAFSGRKNSRQASRPRRRLCLGPRKGDR